MTVAFRAQIQRSGNATGIPAPEEAVLSLGADLRRLIVASGDMSLHLNAVGR